MAAGKYSFVIEQGATTNLNIQWTDNSGSAIDLTGYSARMQIRPGVSDPNVYITLSSSLQPDGTGINISGSCNCNPPSSGSVGIYISAYSSSLLTFDEAFYDLDMINGKEVTRLLEGKVKLSKTVTR